MDAVGVGDGGRLDDRAQGQAGNLSLVGQVGKNGFALVMPHGAQNIHHLLLVAAQLVEVSLGQVVRAGRVALHLGVDVIAGCDRSLEAELVHAQGLLVVFAAAEELREELGDVAVLRRGVGAEPQQALPTEGEVHRGAKGRAAVRNLAGLQCGVQGPQALLRQGAQLRHGVLPVGAHIVKPGQVIDAAGRKRDLVRRRVQNVRQVLPDIESTDAQPGHLRPRRLAHGAADRRHGVGVIEKERLGCQFQHILGDGDHCRDHAQGARSAARPGRIAHGVI